MKNVSKITCESGAGFVQEFRVVWKEGEHTRVSDWTSGRYPNPQSKTVELSQFGIPVGSEVWVEVHAIAGKTKQAGDHVAYSPDSDDAAWYKTTGTTLIYSIKLMN